LTDQTNERGDARNRCQHSSDSYSSRSTLGRALTCARCAAARLGAVVGAQGLQRHSNLGAGIGGYSNQVGFLNVLWQSQRYASTAKFILLRIFFSIPLSVDIGGLLHVAHGDGRCGSLWIFFHSVVKRGEVKSNFFTSCQGAFGADADIGVTFLYLCAICNVVIEN